MKRRKKEIFGCFNGKAISRLREVIFEEFAASKNYGMIFTYMWEEFIGMEGTEQEINNPAWTCIRNARRVLDVFRSIPVITFLDISRLEFSV